MSTSRQSEDSFAIEQHVRKIHNDEVSPKQLWRQLNMFRSNPKHLYSLVSARKNYYNKQGMLFSMFHPNRSIKTSEGRDSINELLEQLVNQEPLNPIAYNSELNNRADDLARQFKSCQISNMQFELNPHELRRMLEQSPKYIFPHPVTCVVGVGFRDQYQPMLSLLIDDGSNTKLNRRKFFCKQYEVCGIGAVPLQDPSLVCAVYLFTKSVIPKTMINQAFRKS